MASSIKPTNISGTSFEVLKRRADSLKRRLEILDRYVDSLSKKMGPELKQLYHSYKGYEEVLKAMRLSGFSAKAMFITGWMDARDKAKAYHHSQGDLRRAVYCFRRAGSRRPCPADEHPSVQAL